jgi:hypothetical protein
MTIWLLLLALTVIVGGALFITVGVLLCLLTRDCDDVPD